MRDEVVEHRQERGGTRARRAAQHALGGQRAQRVERVSRRPPTSRASTCASTAGPSPRRGVFQIRQNDTRSAGFTSSRRCASRSFTSRRWKNETPPTIS